MYDRLQNRYVPTLAGFGMHVQVHDPDDKVVLARVRFASTPNTLPLTTNNQAAGYRMPVDSFQLI